MVRLNKAMKGGSKVKAKAETEEEKLVRAEMEALAAEEENRRRVEAAHMALQEKLAWEARYTKVNAVKIHNQWRKLMRMTKVDELRREIEVLSQNHEREVDRKDSILQMVDRDLEDAEEQYQLAHRSHLQILDSLYDLQYMRLRSLGGLFQSFLTQLEHEYDAERTEINNAHARHKKDFATLMAAMEAEFAEADAEANQDFESQREVVAPASIRSPVSAHDGVWRCRSWDRSRRTTSSRDTQPRSPEGRPCTSTSRCPSAG